MRIAVILSRPSIAAAVLVALCSGPVIAQSGSVARASSKADLAGLSNIQIDNFGRISPSYYRGAQPVGRDYADLASFGVKTVINLTSDDASADEPSMVEQSGMRYVAIPMTTRVAPTAAQLAQFLEVVNDPASQPVYVHCVGGKHRTGVMTAVYRITQHAWTSDQAFGEMKRFKFGADFLHPEFKKFVYGFTVAPVADKAPAPLVAATKIAR